MTETRPARCKACGSTAPRPNMVAYGMSTAEPVHSTCENLFFGSTFIGNSQRRAAAFSHPLYRDKRAGECVGYIVDKTLTDSLGWMRRST